MDIIYKQIVVMEVEIMRSNTEPYHYQNRTHTINQYDPEYYKELFAKLQLVERLYGDLKSIMKQYEEKEEIKDE